VSPILEPLTIDHKVATHQVSLIDSVAEPTLNADKTFSSYKLLIDLFIVVDIIPL
jgi:hypothetical protein